MGQVGGVGEQSSRLLTAWHLLALSLFPKGTRGTPMRPGRMWEGGTKSGDSGSAP